MQVHPAGLFQPGQLGHARLLSITQTRQSREKTSQSSGHDRNEQEQHPFPVTIWVIGIAQLTTTFPNVPVPSTSCTSYSCFLTKLGGWGKSASFSDRCFMSRISDSRIPRGVRPEGRQDMRQLRPNGLTVPRMSGVGQIRVSAAA